MLKAGIYLDIEHLSRNGGWGMRIDVIKELVVHQGADLVRANAYMAVDRERENANRAYRNRKEEYRNAIRRAGYHLVLKDVAQWEDANGDLVVKADAAVDLAVDALQQADNLDYVLIGSGDADFTRLIRALQSRGKRVDLLGFGNVDPDLKIEADAYHSAFLVPGVLPAEAQEQGRVRGTMHAVNEDKGYGFLTIRTGLGPGEERGDVFLHIRDFQREGEFVDNANFARLKTREAIVEFDLVEDEEGRAKAVRAEEFDWLSRERAAIERAAERASERTSDRAPERTPQPA